MSTKHTPTPLRYTRPDSDGEVDILTEYGKDSASVGHCYGVGNGRLLTAAFNSYAKHCNDPVAAAESLLGRALEGLRDLYNEIADSPHTRDTHISEGAFKIARALLAETKEGA